MLTNTFYDKDFSCLVGIGTGQREEDLKHYMYCEISYHTNGQFYKQVFDAKYFDKVMHTYNMITKRMIPENEIVQTIKNIKKM